MVAYSELRNREFYQRVIYIMVPVLLQQLITVGVNFLDNIMVGSFGEAQINGASLSNQFYNIFQNMCIGIGSGAIVMTSQFWGQKERDALKIVAAIAMRFAFVIGLLFTLFSMLFPHVILEIYTNDAATIQEGIPYLRLVGATFLLTGFSTTATFLLRSTQQVRIPLISSAIAFFLNLFFNWIFIFGKFGAPRLEIVGTAVGTVIARTFEFLFVVGYFAFREKQIGFRPRYLLVPGGALTRQYLRYSVPVFLSDTLLGVGLSVVSVIMGHISATMVAANAIVFNASVLLTVLNVAWGQSAAVVIGNTIGGGDTDRAFREGVAYCTLSFLFGILCSVLILLLQGAYLSIFEIQPETIETARSLFLCTAIMTPLQTVAVVTTKGILRGGGDTRFLLVGDIILLWLLSIPLGCLAGFVWHLSAFWTYFFLKLEYGTKAIIFLARFMTRKWIKVIRAA